MIDHNNSWDASEEVIRITREEAMSSHVDDLLIRQKSFQGDTRITHRAVKWYYRNWFVFMIAGALAAIVAWGIFEPFFDDYFYIQGRIEDMRISESMPIRLISMNQNIDDKIPGQNWIKIRDQKIWLYPGILELHDDGTKSKLDLSKISINQEVGIYINYKSLGGEGLALANFIDLSPPNNPPKKAFLSLEQLNARHIAAGLLIFPLVAGFIGLAIGSIDGMICRLLRRALWSGFVGFLVGFIGGFFAGILAGFIYVLFNRLAIREIVGASYSMTGFGFVVQIVGRTIAWGMAGMAMGLGQGIALRSKRLFVYGLLGGIIGGLLGGLLFDPVDIVLIGMNKPSSHWSRLIGIAIIGASVGFMIGIVELLARDAWLRMTAGPLAGKEFLIFKDVMKIGASPRSDIYLFNDPMVADYHALIRAVGDQCEIENQDERNPVLLNNRMIKNARLHQGDRITIGQTSFIFERRQG